MKTRTPRQEYLLSRKKQKIKIIAIQAAIFVLFVIFWEAATFFNIIDSFFISSPSRITACFLDMVQKDLFKHIGITLGECIAGFLISTLLGMLIAVSLWWSETARKVLDPYIVVLNSLPKIALGPIIIIWAGAGIKAIIIMTLLICIIVTIISTLNGFLACDEGKILLLKSMGATKFQIFIKLVLPRALPDLISVLKINIGLAWVGTIMGEYLVSSAGLGYLIIYGGQVFQMDLVMTSVVILCVLAAIMYFGIATLERHFKQSR